MSSPSSVGSDLVRSGGSGFPTDYLAARIKGRQAALIADWRRLAVVGAPADLSDERIWAMFLAELAWLHRQMNNQLRSAVAPLLGVFETKTIVLALRIIAARRVAALPALLENSLLPVGVQTGLRSAGDVQTAVDQLTRTLTAANPAFKDIAALHQTDGLRGVEDGLVRAYLEQVSAQRGDAEVTAFFRQLIDLRNVMLAYKHVRWGAQRAPRFIRGGSLVRERLEEIVARQDRRALDALITRITGGHPPSRASEGAVETLLMRSISARLRAARHDVDAVGLAVGYVWRVYVQARNLAVLFHARELAPAVLEDELIL